MEDRKQIISRLYTLRAGLSAIFDENKKIITKESEILKIDDAVKSNNDEIARSENEKNRKKDELNARTKWIEEIKDNIAKLKVKFIFNKGNLIGLATGALGGLIIGWLVACIKASFFDGNIDDYTGMTVWMWVLGGALVGLAIVFLFNCWIIGSDIKRENSSRAEYKRDIKKYNKEIEDKNKLKETLLNKNKAFADNRKIAVVNYKEEANEVVPIIKIMYEALIREFNDDLDARDWQHLDLIIFYLETGRADTIKEALYQVDRQKQNDRLVEAIGEATELLCKTIKSSISSLQSSINENFRRLSFQLREQHREQLGALGNLNSNLNSIGTRLDHIGTNSAMQTALLNNINTNSNELANVASKIYEYGVKAY